jgi:hypothetical protein
MESVARSGPNPGMLRRPVCPFVAAKSGVEFRVDGLHLLSQPEDFAGEAGDDPCSGVLPDNDGVLPVRGRDGGFGDFSRFSASFVPQPGVSAR